MGHKFLYSPYTELWIPDDNTIRLAGELSKKNNINTKYIGWLSKAKKIEIKIKYDVAIILSGPEPQRSIFEKLIIEQLELFSSRAILVRGTNVPLERTCNCDVLDLVTSEELDIIKTLASFPEIVEGSASAMEPHRIAFFLQDLAIAFHSYYNKTRVIVDDRRLSQARLYLVSAAKIVVSNALGLLGVNAPEKM